MVIPQCPCCSVLSLSFLLDCGNSQCPCCSVISLSFLLDGGNSQCPCCSVISLSFLLDCGNASMSLLFVDKCIIPFGLW